MKPFRYTTIAFLAITDFLIFSYVGSLIALNIDKYV